MALDYISNLPTELLLLVFDFLDSRTRRTVSGVCQRWTEIITPRYRSVTDESEKVDLSAAKLLRAKNSGELGGFRNVEIDCYKYGTMAKIAMVEDYLFNRDLVENLVELSIDQMLYRFQREADLVFPNLQTLRIKYFDPIDFLGNEHTLEGYVEPQDLDPLWTPQGLRYRIIAPKLRALHQLCGDTLMEPLAMYSEQIETLVVNVEVPAELVSTMGNLHYANVRRLTLIVRGMVDSDHSDGPVECFQETDFNAELRALFGRLHHLTILGNDNWHPVLSFIVGQAKNLRTLSIYEQDSDQSTLLQISQLQHLETLTLMFKDLIPHPLVLSQPNVVLVKTNLVESISLQNVPRLKLLDLQFPEYCEKPDFVSFFQPVAHQLEGLCLREVTLDRNLIDGIGSLVNLSTLKLSCIFGETIDLAELLRRLPKLRFAGFQECNLDGPIGLGAEENSDDEVYDGEEEFFICWLIERAAVRFRKFFKQLSLRYVDCAMWAEECLCKP